MVAAHVHYDGDGNPDAGLTYGDLALEYLRKHQHETRPAQVRVVVRW